MCEPHQHRATDLVVAALVERVDTLERAVIWLYDCNQKLQEQLALEHFKLSLTISQVDKYPLKVARELDRQSWGRIRELEHELSLLLEKKVEREEAKEQPAIIRGVAGL